MNETVSSIEDVERIEEVAQDSQPLHFDEIGSIEEEEGEDMF